MVPPKKTDALFVALTPMITEDDVAPAGIVKARCAKTPDADTLYVFIQTETVKGEFVAGITLAPVSDESTLVLMLFGKSAACPFLPSA